MSRFSLDAPVNIATALGRKISVKVEDAAQGAAGLAADPSTA